ncbi:MAG: hypothetical protein RL153_570, partial [Verrucomicrobiota bacterium]
MDDPRLLRARALTRRQFFSRAGGLGVGSLALGELLARDGATGARGQA